MFVHYRMSDKEPRTLLQVRWSDTHTVVSKAGMAAMRERRGLRNLVQVRLQGEHPLKTPAALQYLA